MCYDGGYRAGKRAQAEAQRLTIAQEVADAARDAAVAAERLRLAERQVAFAAAAAAKTKRTYAGLAKALGRDLGRQGTPARRRFGFFR